MSHPYTKKEKIDIRKKQYNKIKKLYSYGYDPFRGWPVYADKRLHYTKVPWNEFDDFLKFKGKYNDEIFYIKESSSSHNRRFYKKKASKAVRRIDISKGANYKKAYEIWWQLI